MSVPGSPDAGDDTLARVIVVLRRRALWGLGVAAVVFGAVAAIVLLARPVYLADARLRLGEPPPTTGVSPTGGLLSFLRTGGDPFANDLELLSSRTLAEEVVRAAHLNVQLVAPSGWHRDSIFASLAQTDTTAKATFEATWQPDGTIRLEALSPRRADLGSVRPGEAIGFGGMRASFLARKDGGPRSVELKTVPFDEAVRVERGRIDVERTRREANVLDVRYRHHDPAVAELVVQSVVGVFLDLRTRLFQRESGETVDSLRAVAANTQKELLHAEDALEAIQRETGLVAPDAQSEALIERYETAYEALLEARTEQDAIAAQLARVEAADNRIDAWSTLVAHPRFLENETLSGLLDRLTLLEELKTAALSLRTPDSREVRTLESQITQLDGALRKVIDEFAVGLDARVDELESQLANLERVLGRLPSQVVQLGRRQRDVRVLTEVVVVTEQRLRQEELRQALAFSNIQVVDPPTLRFRPVWPRKKLGLAVGMLLAGFSGLGAMVLLERADPSLREGTVLRALTGAPVLAAPVARGGALMLGGEELRALLGSSGSARSFVLAPGAEPWKDAVAREVGAPEGAVRGIAGFADALALADSPAVIVVTAGRTPETAIRRIVSLLGEAGGSVAGSLVVCRSAREASSWV